MDANRYHEGARCETFESLSKQKKLDAEGKLVRCDRT